MWLSKRLQLESFEYYFCFQVTFCYKKNIKDYLCKENLGSNLKENEELLQEHKQMEIQVKVGTFLFETIILRLSLSHLDSDLVILPLTPLTSLAGDLGMPWKLIRWPWVILSQSASLTVHIGWQLRGCGGRGENNIILGPYEGGKWDKNK